MAVLNIRGPEPFLEPPVEKDSPKLHITILCEEAHDQAAVSRSPPLVLVV